MFEDLLQVVCKSFDLQKSVIIQPEQAMWTHPGIGLMTARQQARNWLTVTCSLLTVYYNMKIVKFKGTYIFCSLVFVCFTQ